MQKKQSCEYLIVGAGLSGCVLAEQLASRTGEIVILVDKRHHIGGNCYDEYDGHGILVHRYGPHIFHTNSSKVIEYLSRFTAWIDYEHTVLARHHGEVYPIPINRTTVNKLYGLALSTDDEVGAFFMSVRELRSGLLNSEDVVVSHVGRDLFERFFRHYTKKQWGMEPNELVPSVCARIPFRVNDDSRYFSDVYQCMPSDGYAAMFERMVRRENIDIRLSTEYRSLRDAIDCKHMIYTGPIDEYFGYKFGRLPYRSIRFEFEHHAADSVQQAAQVNYVDADVDFTRVVEYKKLTGQIAAGSTVSREYPQKQGEPYYPIPTTANRRLYDLYRREARADRSVTFAGRLAEYQYYNMDQVVGNSLTIADALVGERRA